MAAKKPDKKADIRAAADRGESTSSAEPLLIGQDSRHREPISELAFELTKRSVAFCGGLPGPVREALASLVRSMNCYYSNLIEGNHTHPIDIERALQADYSLDPEKRDLQREAQAHIEVQEWIDAGGLAPGREVTVAGICEIHRRFCERLPDDLLWVEDPATGERVRVGAGELRHRDVRVGRHLPVSPGALPRFFQRFEEVYSRISPSESLINLAATHHRLVWLHPFLDGNGRVARLMSHAQLLRVLDTGGVWSVSRGLAREVRTYKGLLANCDLTRRNDLDGRGNLSEEALAAFTSFFLKACIDQVTFMESLMQPERLRARVQVWAEEEIRAGELPAKADRVLREVLYRGELPRGEAASVVGTVDRQSRRIVSALLSKGVLSSASPRMPLRLAFPAKLASRWLPGLFPDYS